MNLPLELDPTETRHYAVLYVARATGSRRITLITPDRAFATEEARKIDGYVLEISRIADFR